MFGLFGKKTPSPELLIWREIVTKAQACTSKAQLFDINLGGKSIVQWLSNTKTDSMSAKEKEEYYALVNKYRDIEQGLN
jgi:hypothetical protein